MFDDLEERLAKALATADCTAPLLWDKSPDGFKERWRHNARAALAELAPELSVNEGLQRLVFEARISDPIVEIKTEDLVARLWRHVRSRGKPSVPNGAWGLMLEAARQLSAYTRCR